MTTPDKTPPDEFVGYGPAAEYVGVQRNTLSGYVARGIGPMADRHEPHGQYILPVFTRAELDEWVKNRPGQGARTDLVPVAA